MMRVVRTVGQMQRIAEGARRAGRSIGFVPTMGALHEAHASLIRRCRQENDLAVVSIFVNPAQFGPAEDLSRYPRPYAQDIHLCRKEKVDVVFYPAAAQMYPPGFKTYVEVHELSSVLCGAYRPGHFRGVATVVLKLFNIVMPHRAYFGQKDAQQAAVIRQLVSDLNVPVKLVVMPIVREKSGLALSSRNVYLKSGEREDAAILSRALMLARQLSSRGVRQAVRIKARMRALIRSKRTARIEYIEIVDLATLKPVSALRGDCLVALAVRFGKTRLIDNMVVRR